MEGGGGGRVEYKSIFSGVNHQPTTPGTAKHADGSI